MPLFGHTSEVADICINWANNAQKMIWETSQHGNTTLYNYAFSGGATPVANANVIHPSTIAACWELPLLALIAGGYYAKSDITNLLKKDPACTIPATLQPSFFPGIQPYGPTATLKKGHLAFFNGMNHVAVLTGNRSAGQAEVISFWAWDGLQAVPPGSPLGGPINNIVIRFATVEWLQQIISPANPSACAVVLSKPIWG